MSLVSKTLIRTPIFWELSLPEPLESSEQASKTLTREEYKAELRKYFPTLKRWKSSDAELPHANSPIKQKLIEEVNALNIKDMPTIDNLFVLQGTFINQEYKINGNSVKLLDDNASYWGNQVEKQNAEGRCFGIACDERYILVSEYGKNGADAEIVVFKKR